MKRTIRLLTILLAVSFNSIFAYDENKNNSLKEDLVWEAEIIDNNLKIAKNQFSSIYSQKEFPFKYIGKKNFEGFYKNQIFFLESHGFQAFKIDLKDSLAEISNDGNIFLNHKENKESKNSFRYTYSRDSAREVMWDQYKINRNIENVYLSPSGAFIVVTHGNNDDISNYIKFINTKGDIFATYNFPSKKVVFSSDGDYLLSYNNNAFTVFNKNGNKIFQETIGANIGKNVLIGKNGNSIVTTEEEPYILNLYSIAGKKLLDLKLEESVISLGLSKDNNSLVFIQEVLIGSSLKYSMKLIDLKSNTQTFDRELPLYTEEYPEIYIGNNYIVVIYFNSGINYSKEYSVFLYDFKGNILKRSTYSTKPVFSEDNNYMLILENNKIFLYEIHIENT